MEPHFQNNNKAKPSKTIAGRGGVMPLLPKISQEPAGTLDEKKCILVIGATGHTGLACVRRFSTHKPGMEVHAFCQYSSKLCNQDELLFKSVIKGDAADKKDIELALTKSNANVVIVCIENGSSIQRRRTASASALVAVLKKKKFKHVHALVVSRVGACGSWIPIGIGIGKIITCHHHLLLRDHAGQEKAFSSLNKRVTIVRPTVVNDAKPLGRVTEFGSKDKVGSITIPRGDLASWIVDEVCSGVSIGGRIVNITGTRSDWLPF